ncbi:hypothetical protein ACFPZ0_11595 [Streptomonospora nanhaiensis]|uniref:Uncharacterized protein n=1 Tax=Streptomonospora nanhaiensis TaxID=1323731 RepID=A0A853BPG8_9ACTN|nr:hypothetical protein [Streptomonospora nanhaiensis]MBV2366071.1 hypothetical protein [Streptomonospora nanhaiensis]MBX9388895.1 hypothetical protein [Streptomonospora nanhaiensis]NYI96546.1 hypothetical protein [Streptomonospora nanhaiensis]
MAPISDIVLTLPLAAGTVAVCGWVFARSAARLADHGLDYPPLLLRGDEIRGRQRVRAEGLRRRAELLAAAEAEVLSGAAGSGDAVARLDADLALLEGEVEDRLAEVGAETAAARDRAEAGRRPARAVDIALVAASTAAALVALVAVLLLVL